MASRNKQEAIQAASISRVCTSGVLPQLVCWACFFLVGKLNASSVHRFILWKIRLQDRLLYPRKSTTLCAQEERVRKSERAREGRYGRERKKSRGEQAWACPRLHFALRALGYRVWPHTHTLLMPMTFVFNPFHQSPELVCVCARATRASENLRTMRANRGRKARPLDDGGGAKREPSLSCAPPSPPASFIRKHAISTDTYDSVRMTD